MRSFEHNNSSVQQAGLLGHWSLTERCWHFVSSWNWKLDTNMKPLYYAVVNKPQLQDIRCYVQSYPQIHSTHEFLCCGQTNPGLNYTEWASGEGAAQGYSVPLRTGTCYIRHFGAVFARLLCSAGTTNENEFQFSGSPTPCVSNDVTFGHAHTLCSATWLNSLVNLLDGDKCQNAQTLKCCKCRSFSGDIESWEPSTF